MKTAETNDTERERKHELLDENAVCDVCGAFGAYHFGDRTLCLNCYEGYGSCCLEFGKDDLWQAREQD